VEKNIVVDFLGDNRSKEFGQSFQRRD